MSSCVTAQLICAFIYTYPKSWFFHDTTQMNRCTAKLCSQLSLIRILAVPSFGSYWLSFICLSMDVFQKRIRSLQHGKHVQDVGQFLLIFVAIFFHLISCLLWDRPSDSDSVVGSLVISPGGVVGSLVISLGDCRDHLTVTQRLADW